MPINTLENMPNSDTRGLKVNIKLIATSILVLQWGQVLYLPHSFKAFEKKPILFSHTGHFII